MDKPLTFLIVDDDLALRDLIALGLKREFGCQVLTADNGVEALRCIAETPPEVMILEIMLSQLNGLELLKSFRKTGSEGTKSPIAIVASALGFQEVVTQAVSAGAKDFIVKPFDVETLLLRVREALSDLPLSAD